MTNMLVPNVETVSPPWLVHKCLDDSTAGMQAISIDIGFLATCP
jgi:hypothetical protein